MCIYMMFVSNKHTHTLIHCGFVVDDALTMRTTRVQLHARHVAIAIKRMLSLPSGLTYQQNNDNCTLDRCSATLIMPHCDSTRMHFALPASNNLQRYSGCLTIQLLIQLVVYKTSALF